MTIVPDLHRKIPVANLVFEKEKAHAGQVELFHAEFFTKEVHSTHKGGIIFGCFGMGKK
jgi:hypothetical protein